METEKTTFPKEVKATAEHILKSKSQSGMSSSSISGNSFEKTYNRVHQVYQFHQNKLDSP